MSFYQQKEEAFIMNNRVVVRYKHSILFVLSVWLISSWLITNCEKLQKYQPQMKSGYPAIPMKINRPPPPDWIL